MYLRENIVQSEHNLMNIFGAQEYSFWELTAPTLNFRKARVKKFAGQKTLYNLRI